MNTRKQLDVKRYATVSKRFKVPAQGIILTMSLLMLGVFRQQIVNAFQKYTTVVGACTSYKNSRCYGSFIGCLAPGDLATAFLKHPFLKHPFLKNSSEATIKCGFQAERYKLMLSDAHEKYAACKIVLFVTMIGRISQVPQYCSDETFVCFVTIADESTYSVLSQMKMVTDCWSLLNVGPWSDIGDSTELVAHSVRLLGPKIFPDADFIVYHDLKSTHFINNSSELFSGIRKFSKTSKDVQMLVLEHHHHDRDVFGEFISVFAHLYQRRIRQTSQYSQAIRGEQFSRVMKQYLTYEDLGFPMHHTGMSDNGLIIWLSDTTERKGQNRLFSCLWNNEIFIHSMRTQLSFEFIIWSLRAHQHVWRISRDFTHGKINTRGPIVQGETKHDDEW